MLACSPKSLVCKFPPPIEFENRADFASMSERRTGGQWQTRMFPGPISRAARAIQRTSSGAQRSCVGWCTPSWHERLWMHTQHSLRGHSSGAPDMTPRSVRGSSCGMPQTAPMRASIRWRTFRLPRKLRSAGLAGSRETGGKHQRHVSQVLNFPSFRGCSLTSKWQSAW